ncbi:DNA-3-methyladenine glycosylase [Aneurinibacillus tyrosinisolvens]|uniref:DNA-3-methyladenine glycosylase n=1 Tax=Aneurinibacillus tyrosinisolvens TaxID=1443435 RepID=UPI00063FC9EC|nr:DNA-3-methyladenine glycosylase [Aneurinibacillus tyrosinisolvens]
MKLTREFYNRDTLTVARELLGKRLVHVIDGVERGGKIVEVEAYIGPEDKASHTYNGRRTERNEAMYGPPGHVYVYFIYGMYHCVNVVTNAEGKPEAVLLRALEPTDGIEQIVEARYGKTGPVSRREYINLLNGPGKICRGLAIDRKHNGMDLCGDELFITSDFSPGTANEEAFQIEAGPRINIHYAEEAIHYPWRFYIAGNPFVKKINAVKPKRGQERL